MKCPICKKPVDPNSKNRPFCSDRCRLLDLGNWASEKYIIPTPLDEADDRDLPEDPARR